MPDKTVYIRTQLIGGGVNAIDGIDGNDLLDEDYCFAPIYDHIKYEYSLVADSGATEKVPFVISPDANAGTKRWHLKTPYVVYADPTVTDQGAATAEGYRSIKDLVDAIGATRKATIILEPTGTGDTTTYTLTTSETIPSNITLRMKPGAILDGAGTLTINGPFEAGLYQVFGSSITVYFGTGAIESTKPEWWGNNTTPGTTDMTAEIQAAENSLGTTGGIIQLSRGKYLISSSLKLGTGAWGYAVILQGMGPAATQIVSDMTDTMIESPDTSTDNYRVTIRDLQLDNTDKTNAGSIGIDLTRQHVCRIDNVRIVNVETGIYLAGSQAYYNEIYATEIHTVVTGIYIGGTRANDTKIVNGRIDIFTTGINVEAAFNTDIIGTAIEVGTTGIRINDAQTHVIGALLDTCTTGIEVTSSANKTSLMANAYSSNTTNVSDSGTNTQQYDSDGKFQAAPDGTLTHDTRAKQFFKSGTGLDDTIAIAITFPSQVARHIDTIIEIWAAIKDIATSTRYSSIVRYAVNSIDGVSNYTDMTHDLVGGVTEAIADAGMVITVTLTLPGGVDIDEYSIWVKTLSSHANGVPTGISVS